MELVKFYYVAVNSMEWENILTNEYSHNSHLNVPVSPDITVSMFNLSTQEL